MTNTLHWLTPCKKPCWNVTRFLFTVMANLKWTTEKHGYTKIKGYLHLSIICPNFRIYHIFSMANPNVRTDAWYTWLDKMRPEPSSTPFTLRTETYTLPIDWVVSVLDNLEGDPSRLKRWLAGLTLLGWDATDWPSITQLVWRGILLQQSRITASYCLTFLKYVGLVHNIDLISGTTWITDITTTDK